MTNLIEQFRAFLAGAKTYITAAAAVLTALAAFAVGEIDLVGLVTAVFAALGLASLRAGVTTEVKKVAGE